MGRRESECDRVSALARLESVFAPALKIVLVIWHKIDPDASTTASSGKTIASSGAMKCVSSATKIIRAISGSSIPAGPHGALRGRIPRRVGAP